MLIYSVVLYGFVKEYHDLYGCVQKYHSMVLNLMKKYSRSAMIFLRHFNDYCGNTVDIIHRPTIAMLKMFIFN